MSLERLNPFPRGTKAPNFSLTNTVDESIVTLYDQPEYRATVIMFICNHCPFVLHVNKALVELAQDYSAQGVNFIAISSNNVETHPQDGPDFMKQHALDHNYPFPYLYDETQEVAKAYDAACTPDFYIFDKDLKSVYHGQLDDSRPGNGKAVTGQDIRDVLVSLIVSGSYSGKEEPSVGCNIKWK